MNTIIYFKEKKRKDQFVLKKMRQDSGPFIIELKINKIIIIIIETQTDFF